MGEGSPGRRTGLAALGFPTAGLGKGMAAEVPETGLSLPSCPESMERLVEQKGTQGSKQLLVSQWQRNKGRRGRECGVEEELPAWPRKQEVAGQLHAGRRGQELGLSLLPSWELSFSAAQVQGQMWQPVFTATG